MSFLKKLIKTKPNENSVAFRREMAEKVAGKVIYGCKVTYFLKTKQ